MLASMYSRVGVAVALVMVTPSHAIAFARAINAIERSHLSDSLTTGQIENLVLLGKVWGFTKYHHAGVTSGRLDWDAELRRVLPSVLEWRGRAAATTAMANWLATLDAPDACRPCAAMPADLHLRPNIDWIRDEQVLGRQLSTWLVRTHHNRRAFAEQHYVTFVPNVGNPVFRNEKEYADALPSADLRLLALYRFWNIIEYWSPYRDLIEEDWDAVLGEFVPRLWMSDSKDAYQLSMLALVARIHDGHASISPFGVRPPRGSHRLPVNLRFIEGKFVVTSFSFVRRGPASGLRVGDVVSSIGGARVESLAAAWTPYYSASNQSSRLSDIAFMMPQGPPGPVRVTGERAGSRFDMQVERVSGDSADDVVRDSHDLPGETFQLLTKDVAYLKLSSVVKEQSTKYIRKAAGAKVLVIDIRNYPSGFVVFALGEHLVPVKTAFARFTRGDASNPGAFVWSPPLTLRPVRPRFKGRVVILVDDVSGSNSEYTAMAFRSAPNALVVGSTTAGADGNVSRIILPGRLRTRISGIGVFYPDRRPTQRVGIVPDLVVRPTIAGIRAGRDEVLEAAVSRALGREFRLPRRIG